MNQIKKLQDQIEAITARRKRRSEADTKDRNELAALEEKLKRANAQTLIGKDVVLSPNCSILVPELRKLRGVVGRVESIGRKYALVNFTSGERWRIVFTRLVEADSEEAAQNHGQMTDELTDMLNFGLSGK